VNTSHLPILNISCYQFVTLADPQRLRCQLQGNAAANHLKGTLLLAEEGLNLFLAGPAAGVRAFVAYLRALAEFADLTPKESWSAVTPFQRLKVKVKREIIRMNHPGIRPQAGRAPSVAPQVLARWLAQGHDDEGRPVVTLDTRNAFEIDHGTFTGAIDWRITKFSEFPDAVQAHRDQLAGKTVVSFCTGGIRCEKAAIYLQDIGLDHVYQLEGGILKYFEETDGAPGWQGGCFVFDAREALGAQLTPVRALADAAAPPAR
jgi:UPF0176 protein